MMASTSDRRDSADAETTLTAEDRVEALVSALDDEDCREILRLTVDQYCTANEIAAQCDMPLSTTYRKLDRLTDAELLAERTSIDRSGNHATEYARQVDSLVVDISHDGGVEVTISHREDREGPERQSPAMSPS